MADEYRESILEAIEALKKIGAVFDDGLTDDEINQLETIFSIKFPPDLRFFYQNFLPISISTESGSNFFPSWREAITNEESRKDILKFNKWILDGICFDVERNDFWIADWGTKPTSIEERIRIAALRYSEAPKLIPIYQHRCIPSLNEPYNPIYSIWQTDIIRYGDDLVSYLCTEFNLSLEYSTQKKSVSIPFWDNMVELNKIRTNHN